MKRPASLMAAVLFIFMAIGQLIRFIFGLSVFIGGIEIPVWPSGVAAMVLAVLAVWLLKEASRSFPPIGSE
ncbi:MAG: hypothetical protein JXA41_03920 [Deltaproteobacteria bacterium]|nr:hypothetical protein [Deltaproteobacteria bacterium]